MKKIIIFVLIAALFQPVFLIFADNGGSIAAKGENDQLQAKLRAELQSIEKQIDEYEKELKGIKGEKNTLQNKIKQLQKQQSSINLQIKSSTLQIAELEDKLAAAKSSIDANIAKMNELRGQMSEMMRLINEYDDRSLMSIVLSQDNLSDVLGEVERYSKISSVLGDLLDESFRTEEELKRQEQSLSEQQEEARNLLSIKTLQKTQLTITVNEQNSLLRETKGRENDYQAVLNKSQKKAVEIRGRLYQLLGVSTQITFGEAVQIAQWVSGQTGVRASFLLAILTQESGIGKNVGTCNRAGDPPKKSWKVIMKPSRDQQPFVTITKELGLNTDTTPVSCPMRDKSGNQVGWGGAMGPAQFIPSTWMGYRARVAAITGKPANPWDIRDAFIASALKLKADGAGTKSGEWAAAMRYFSGSTNVRFRFYGDNVVAMANQYQSDIDSMNN